MHQKLERQTWILQRIPQPVVIKDQPVEFVQQFKYLGSIIDNKLTFELQVDFVRRKAHQCVYFYHKLRGFHVDSTFMIILIPVLLNLFLLFFVCWFWVIDPKE